MLLGFAMIAGAQEEKGSAKVREWLESKNFIFKAESVIPARGRLRQLTSPYDLVVKPDTVVAFLPYFGRAYVAPIDPSESGIKFTATDFDYTVKPGKKERWEVTIRPKEAQDVQEMYLTVFNNGKASLRVNSVNRQTISYNGYVEEGNAGKKGF